MKLTISALFLLLLYCQTPMTPLELDLHNHRQHASSLHKKIENAQNFVRMNPQLIKKPNIRNRFLEIPPENHGEQICAVTTYFLLIKYSGAENLGSFEDFYIREIDQENIVETKSTDIPVGFALIPGSNAVNRIVKGYKFSGSKFEIKRSEGSDAFLAFQQANATYAIAGYLNENYSGHYFLVYKDKHKLIRFADAANPKEYGELVEKPFSVIGWLEPIKKNKKQK